MTITERNIKLKHFITCLKCEIHGRECDDNCPTQYEAGNMGEIIENLEEISKALDQQPSKDCISRQAAIEVAKQYWYKPDIAGALAELPSVTLQPNTGHWIPVSERLPEICEKDCHGNITFSKTVLTTQIYGDGFVFVGDDQYTTNNGGWSSEVPFDNPDERCKVIAWMPLPEPYKPQESEEE